MKQVSRLLMGGALLCGLWSCSSDNTPDNPGNNPGANSGTAYLGIQLNLPQQASTRADGDSWANDNFDDGITSEYEVKNAALLLFIGNKNVDEKDAEFFGAYVVTPNDKFETPDNDQITVSFNNAAKLEKKPDLSGKRLWGLALVNYDENIFSIGSNDGTLSVVTSDGSKTVTRIGDENPTKFSDFRMYVSGENQTFRKNGFFMTNAPLGKVPGEAYTIASGSKPETLALLDGSKIKDTKELAVAEPAGCVFVERAVAKVTCGHSSNSLTVKTLGEDGNLTNLTLSYEMKWAIDNEEPTSYFIRNTVTGTTTGLENNLWELANNNRYRFFGAQNMSYSANFDNNTAYHNGRYRSYWCADPSYKNGRNAVSSVTKDTEFKPLSHIFYPRENTFSVANQDHKNTTRVVFEVTFKDGENAANLYCKKDEYKTVYKQSNAENLLKSEIMNSNEILSFIKNNLAEGKEFTGKTFNDVFTATIAANDEKVFTLSDLKFNESFKNDFIKSGVTDDDINAVLKSATDKANKNCVIYEYTGGKSYYTVYIKHFGDTYCPMPEDWKGITTTDVYPTSTDRDAKYLGRWGLVRNNWYDITVDNILSLGSATVPEIDGKSDDNKEENYYIAARFHILSWAKRTQHENLGQ